MVQQQAIAQAVEGVVDRGVVPERETHALLAQVAHEELQADEGEHTEAEDSEDHDVRQLLDRLDQSPHDGLQAWGRGRGGKGWEHRDITGCLVLLLVASTSQMLALMSI